MSSILERISWIFSVKHFIVFTSLKWSVIVGNGDQNIDLFDSIFSQNKEKYLY